MVRQSRRHNYPADTCRQHRVVWTRCWPSDCRTWCYIALAPHNPLLTSAWRDSAYPATCAQIQSPCTADPVSWSLALPPRAGRQAGCCPSIAHCALNAPGQCHVAGWALSPCRAHEPLSPQHLRAVQPMHRDHHSEDNLPQCVYRALPVVLRHCK